MLRTYQRLPLNKTKKLARVKISSKQLTFKNKNFPKPTAKTSAETLNVTPCVRITVSRLPLVLPLELTVHFRGAGRIGSFYSCVPTSSSQKKKKRRDSLKARIMFTLARFGSYTTRWIVHYGVSDNSRSRHDLRIRWAYACVHSMITTKWWWFSNNAENQFWNQQLIRIKQSSSWVVPTIMVV